MVQRIIAEVKAECEATGGDSQRRGYTKHWYLWWFHEIFIVTKMNFLQQNPWNW